MALGFAGRTSQDTARIDRIIVNMGNLRGFRAVGTLLPSSPA